MADVELTGVAVVHRLVLGTRRRPELAALVRERRHVERLHPLDPGTGRVLGTCVLGHPAALGADTCLDVCIDVRLDVCVDMRVGVCLDVRVDVCLDMRVDVCLNICVFAVLLEHMCFCSSS